MNIQFTIEPSDDTDDYREIYTASLVMPDGGTLVVRASEDDLSYDGFRAEVLENVLSDFCEAAGIPLSIETEDYVVSDEIDENVLIYLNDYRDFEDYEAEAERTGC